MKPFPRPLSTRFLTPIAPVRRLVAAATLGAGLVPGLPARGQVSVDWIEPTVGVSIAADAANNVYTATSSQALGTEIVVTKRDVNGHLLWERSFDQTDPTKWEQASWVVADSQGNAIVSGTLKSGYSNPVNAASLVMKWAPDGTLLWRQVYESGFDGSYTKRCLVDGDDNVYVLGMGSGPAGYVTKVKKFTPAGVPVWTYFDADGIGAPVIFKRTPDDALVIAARSIYGSVNGFAKVDLDGHRLWSLPGVLSLTVGDVAGDAAGNSYVVSGEYVAVNPRTVVTKLGPSGARLWENLYDLAGQRVEVGGDGAAVVAGFPNAGTAGAAFIKVDPAGGLVWSNLDADGPLALLLHAQLVLDGNDDAYLAAGTLFAMAVCKVRSDGTTAWTQTSPGGYANALALGPHDNSLFVVGGNTTRWIDPTRGPWQDLGLGLAGVAGIPLLFGEGDLVAGSVLSLNLAAAAPSSPVQLVVGLAPLALPFKGGTLVTNPVLLLPLATDAAGAFTLPATWPAGLPAGTGLYFQAWLPDAAAEKAWSASNGVKALTG